MIVLAEDAMFDLKFWLPFAVNFVMMLIGAIWFFSRLTTKVSVMQESANQRHQQGIEANNRLTKAIDRLTEEYKASGHEVGQRLGKHDVMLAKLDTRLKAVEKPEKDGAGE